jgi:putative phosphoesterase
MLLGILSDTHDQLERTRRAVELLQASGAEALIHCGDFTSAVVVEMCAVLPCWFVFGNNDDWTIPELKQAAKDTGAACLGWAGEVELGGKRIGVAHGHLHTDVRKLVAAQPDYLLTGHSHFAEDRRVGSLRWINPGALHRAREFSAAVLDLQTDDLQVISVPR